MAKITYGRVHPGDPDTVVWNGRSFTHGEAVEFDGRTNEGKAFVEAAKGNPWFSIDGENGDKDTGGTKPPTKKDVEGADPEKAPGMYRAYAIDWINKAPTLRALEGRWNGEAELRDKIGWGSDDQGLIDPIYQPKLENLKRAEA